MAPTVTTIKPTSEQNQCYSQKSSQRVEQNQNLIDDNFLQDVEQEFLNQLNIMNEKPNQKESHYNSNINKLLSNNREYSKDIENSANPTLTNELSRYFNELLLKNDRNRKTVSVNEDERSYQVRILTSYYLPRLC